MKPLLSLVVAYLFLEKSLNFVSGKKYVLEGFMRKVVSLSVKETIRHLLPKTAETARPLPYFVEPHQ
jgi:hypothetical protein